MSVEDIRYSIARKIASKLSSDVEEFIESIASINSCLESVEGLQYSECILKLPSMDSCRNLDVANLCFLGSKPFKAVLKTIKIRYKLLEEIAHLESFAIWKKMLAQIYARYGRGRFKVKVAKGKEYLAFELYSGKVVMVDDRDALNNFLLYRRFRKAVRDLLKMYEDTINELASMQNPIARKATRILLGDARELRKMLRELESNEIKT